MTTRGRSLLAFTGVALAIVAFGTIVFQPPSNEKPDLEPGLVSAADKVGAGGHISLVDVAPFEWDRAYVFGAYTPLDVVTHELGFDWEPMSRFDAWLWGDSFMPNDGFALVVFVRGEHDVTGYRILSPYETPSVYVDADSIVMPRDGASFMVTDGEVGVGWEITPSVD